MGLVEHRPPFVHRVGWFEPSSTAVNAQFSAILSTISTEAAGYCTMNNVLQQQQISGRVVFFSRGAALSCYLPSLACCYQLSPPSICLHRFHNFPTLCSSIHSKSVATLLIQTLKPRRVSGNRQIHAIYLYIYRVIFY